MSRVLLTLLLCLFAAGAMANPPASTEENCPAPKAGKSASPAPGNDNDGTVTGTGATGTTGHTDSASPSARVRTATPRVVTPRWHSLLPGMFR
ncbi:hypothetical protein [Arenimonas oryziterrae]|uniref:Secreted protein n=1 Tax=Arenimonas oryziterrae DSM 21050 = YC6267 TaxID=1121015 RepID=A0A091ATG3_9GAMM|nr:hypothetical protein [Arenimonas oryziterrae]KFN42651.1 hypothetical protein N789_13505 [Arenimonas oryziterrae DSM 21050 = YC6267]